MDIVIEKDSGIVLIKRDIPPCRDHWIFPGGTVRLGESLEEAVGRVAHDETGLVVRVVRRLGVLEYSRRAAFGQVIGIAYLAKATSGELKGNKYGKSVLVFDSLPSRMIAIQRAFLKKEYPMAQRDRPRAVR